MAVSMPISWLQCHIPDLAKAAGEASYDDVAVTALLALFGAGYLLQGIIWNRPDPYEYKLYERPQETFKGNAVQKVTRNIAQKLEESQKDLVVFWGSQSGTAENFANRLARDCHRRFGLQAMAADLSDFDAETIALIPNCKMAIFILSTYGEGDPSDNTTDFWNYLHRNSRVDLSNLRYMAFGLGNRNYKYYNRVVDVVTSAFDKFGAKSLRPVGRADDANGATEEDFLEWKESVYFTLKADLQLAERSPEYEPSLSVIEDESMRRNDLHVGEPIQRLHVKKSATASSPIQAFPIKSARQLFTSSDRRCLHMELDLSPYPEVKYKTGDHMAIWPINPDVEVKRLIKVLGLDEREDIPISIRPLDSALKLVVPTPTTVLALFQYYLELGGPVSRETVASLVQFAPTAWARDLLLKLGGDKEAYASFLVHNHMNFGRLLEYCLQGQKGTWERLPVSFVVESLAPMQPRYYSISSSSIVQPRQVALTAVVSDSYITANDTTQRIHGLATNYMLAMTQSLFSDPHNETRAHPHGLTYPLDGPNESLRDGKVHAHIRKSSFKLPVMASHSIVMVAAGTGIAPFRAFLQERARLQSIGRDVGRMVLVCGFRRSDEDFLYRDEFESFQATFGDKLQIVTAFSREDPTRKVYVQDRIREHAEELCTVLMDGTSYFYVCGSATMARDVAARLGEHLKGKNGWNDVELRSWTEAQKKHGRWQEDVWG